MILSEIWLGFILFFALFAKSLWFYYYFGLYAFKRPTEDKNLFYGKTALIVPCYNEDEDKLRDTIEHVLKADGLDDYYFINDGSSNNTKNVFAEYKHTSIHFINLPENVGKRRAQQVGMKYAVDADVFVCMDSDTILKKNSMVELLKPFRDPSVGGTTACILVRNRSDNILTKAITAMYWSASKIWRQAPSSYNFVQVTNGQLSAYRAELIRDLLPKYVSQEFMGVNCTLSDDRYITHHIQTDYGKKVIYVDTAEVYTYIPTTLKSAYTMFLRWKRGAWRESLLVLKHARKKPILIIDIWANHLVQIMQTIVRIGVIILSFVYTPMILVYYLFIILIISLLFGWHMIWYNTKEVPFRLLYSLINEFYFSWAHIHALITINRQGKWVTR